MTEIPDINIDDSSKNNLAQNNEKEEIIIDIIKEAKIVAPIIEDVSKFIPVVSQIEQLINDVVIVVEESEPILEDLVEKIEENDNGDKEHIECFCNNKCNIL